MKGLDLPLRGAILFPIGSCLYSLEDSATTNTAKAQNRSLSNDLIYVPDQNANMNGLVVIWCWVRYYPRFTIEGCRRSGSSKSLNRSSTCTLLSWGSVTSGTRQSTANAKSVDVGVHDRDPLVLVLLYNLHHELMHLDYLLSESTFVLRTCYHIFIDDDDWEECLGYEMIVLTHFRAWQTLNGCSGGCTHVFILCLQDTQPSSPPPRPWRTPALTAKCLLRVCEVFSTSKVTHACHAFQCLSNWRSENIGLLYFDVLVTPSPVNGVVLLWDFSFENM